MQATATTSSSSMPAQKGLRKLAITGFAEESLKAVLRIAGGTRARQRALARAHATRIKPAKHRALTIGARARGAALDSPTTRYKFLADMGPEAAIALRAAPRISSRSISTPAFPRSSIPTGTAVQLTEVITRRALSNEVITPGRTTVGDVGEWLYDELGREASAPGSSPTFACSGRACPTRPRAAFCTSPPSPR